ncbi:MAG: hypothetical protein Kow0042_00830 [Calditrichia bacterium]
MSDLNFFQTKNFLTRFWNLENEERPAFMIGYVGPRVKGGTPVKSALFSTEGKDKVRDRLLDPEKYLQAQLEEIEGQLKLKGDFIPGLCPSLGVVPIASAFGCEVVWWESDFPSARACIQDDPRQVFDLAPPRVNDGELQRVMDYTRYFIEHTGGRFPIRLTDIQGPLDNAALIMGHNNLMTALITAPDAVHYLMRRVTDLMIEVIKAQREICHSYGVEFVPAMFQPWLPEGLGVAISNDDWVMISPEMHDEFHVPYLNRLSEEFGGIYIHSCGNWKAQFKSIDKIHNLRGIEFGASETPYTEVLERFNGKIALACRVGFNRDIRFHGMADYVKRILSARKTNRGLFINVDITNGVIGDDWPVTDLQEIYQLIGIE